MSRKQKALTPLQHMEMTGKWTDDDLYWTNPRCK